MQTYPLHPIDETAERIRRAYMLRRPPTDFRFVRSGVWTIAATSLLDLHKADPRIPVDPELFVACQAIDAHWADPWQELTGFASARRYRRRVRQIVRRLQAELVQELRRGRARVRKAGNLENALALKSRSISPLGRYILAHKLGRPDLAERFRASASEQHRSCPLYRQACSGLLPGASYPVHEVLPGLDARKRKSLHTLEFSVN
jgi:hypothetical protein